MVPLGALLYGTVAALVPMHSFAAGALAFSAGTFVYISGTELLPHVYREARGRWLLQVFAVGSGLTLMLILARSGTPLSEAAVPVPAAPVVDVLPVVAG